VRLSVDGSLKILTAITPTAGIESQKNSNYFLAVTSDKVKAHCHVGTIILYPERPSWNMERGTERILSMQMTTDLAHAARTNEIPNGPGGPIDDRRWQAPVTI
jgi:hypothetical protein